MPVLREAIDAMPAGDNLTFLVTAQGKPFSAAAFGNWFREICNEASLPKRCTSHGLRRLQQLGSPIAAPLQRSSWRGSAGRPPASQSDTREMRTGNERQRVPASSLPEQKLANQKSSLPKRKLSD